MKLKYVSWLPAVIIMIVIFCFSAKPADNSNESSLTVANEIITIYENITNDQLNEDTRSEVLDTLNFFVRKGAHFSEYAILAAAFAFHLLVLKRKGMLLYILPVILSCFYAATDEYHQTFVAGRTGMLRDVLIDTSGAALGSLIFTLCIILSLRRSSHRQDKRIKS